MIASLCTQFPGRLPSEVDAEPLLPMLQTISMQHATRAWGALRSAMREGRSIDDLHGLPGIESAIELYGDVMGEVRHRSALRRAAEVSG